LDLPLTTLVGITRKRKKLLTCTQDTQDQSVGVS
jgi:hypothetical protein